MAVVLRNLCLLLGLVPSASGHGAMSSPRPRNNEHNATSVKQKTMARFVMTSNGVVEQYFPHGHGMCSGPAENINLTDGKCINLSSYSVILSTKQPASTAKQVVDCTAHNDCRLGSLDNMVEASSVGFVWYAIWYSTDCSTEAAMLYKMNLDACTAFDGLELDSTTPGCEGLSCLWFSQGCGIGCPKCTEDNANFFSSPCNGTKQPTINDPKLRTFNRYGTDVQGDWTASHPWRAPGSAPVLDPCGMAGGSTKNNDQAAGYAPAPGHQMGDKGSQLMPSAKVVWTAGSKVETAWGLWANHGGGYQYRLCSKSEALTEECFQRLPLQFAKSTQKLRLGSGRELEIPATLVSDGTLPEGSTWAMNPVPACSEWYGSNCSAPQFPPPAGCDETCWGYLGPGGGNASHTLPTIVDEVMVPQDLAPGDYVLGFRWDCEQTPQVWASCADVEIVRADQMLI